jgi:arylsulfatase
MSEKEKTSFVYYPGTARIPEDSVPRTQNRSFTITAEVEIPARDPDEGSRTEGPICAIGGTSLGWSLYIKDSRLVYCYNYLSKRLYIRSTKEVPIDGKVKLRYEFEKTGQEKFGAGGICRLFINDDKVGEGQILLTAKFRYSFGESFDIGRDSVSSVIEEYNARAQFSDGNIESVVIDLAGERHMDPEAEARIHLQRLALLSLRFFRLFFLSKY